MKPLSPPDSLLPPGASSWILLEELAKVLRKDVRTLKRWCTRQLVYCEPLAGGAGGFWIAVTDSYWPLSNPTGAAAYRQYRSARASVGSPKGAQVSAAVRRAKSQNKGAVRKAE